MLNEEDSTVSVIDSNGMPCRAHGLAAPTSTPVMATGFDPGYLDVDLATDSVYVSNQNENTVSVLERRRLHAHASGGMPAPRGDDDGRRRGPRGAPSTSGTNTVYVGNRDDDDLGDQCREVQRHITRKDAAGRGQPFERESRRGWSMDERTDTVYTANCDADNGCAGDTVSVIDGADCNAHVTSGCGRAPGP